MTLDRQIKVYKRETTRNEYNEKVETLVLFATLFANVNYRGGREGFYARQVIATGDVTFTIRHYAGLDETMVILFDGKMHEINYIEPIGRMHWLAMHTKSADNAPLPPIVEEDDDDDQTDDEE